MRVVLGHQERPKTELIITNARGQAATAGALRWARASHCHTCRPVESLLLAPILSLYPLLEILPDFQLKPRFRKGFSETCKVLDKHLINNRINGVPHAALSDPSSLGSRCYDQCTGGSQEIIS